MHPLAILGAALGLLGLALTHREKADSKGAESAKSVPTTEIRASDAKDHSESSPSDSDSDSDRDRDSSEVGQDDAD